MFIWWSAFEIREIMNSYTHIKYIAKVFATIEAWGDLLSLKWGNFNDKIIVCPSSWGGNVKTDAYYQNQCKLIGWYTPLLTYNSSVDNNTFLMKGSIIIVIVISLYSD